MTSIVQVERSASWRVIDDDFFSLHGIVFQFATALPHVNAAVPAVAVVDAQADGVEREPHAGGQRQYEEGGDDSRWIKEEKIQPLAYVVHASKRTNVA